jgi:Sulfotransferase domain
MKKLLGKLLGKEEPVHITDQAVLDRFLSNPDFPWLISFPRTGSHWLRMIMELYFEKPSLRRIFFYEDATDFTCYHWHDVDLSLTGVKSVIYLYREPVETVYSTLQYHREDIRDQGRIAHWTDVYGAHLHKWLVDESFTSKKTLVRYEGLKQDVCGEFAKVCSHFAQPLDADRLLDVVKKVSKDALKAKTQHDQQVVNVSASYAVTREEFMRDSGDLIRQRIFAQSPRLRDYLASPSS